MQTSGKSVEFLAFYEEIANPLSLVILIGNLDIAIFIFYHID